MRAPLLGGENEIESKDTADQNHERFESRPLFRSCKPFFPNRFAKSCKIPCKLVVFLFFF